MNIYTKTSLKSVKKGDLVEMFLHLQSQVQVLGASDDDEDDSEIEKLKEDLLVEVKENKKLKEEMKQMTLGFDGWMGTLEEYKNNKEELKDINEKYDNLVNTDMVKHVADLIDEIKELKKEKKYAEKCCQENFGCMIELGKENDKLKSEFEKLVEGRLKYQKGNNKLKKEIKDNVIIIQMLQEQTGDLTEEIKILKEHLKHSEDKEKMKKLREASKIAKEAVSQN
jgi:chromosome segregation ATPase